LARDLAGGLEPDADLRRARSDRAISAAARLPARLGVAAGAVLLQLDRRLERDRRAGVRQLPRPVDLGRHRDRDRQRRLYLAPRARARARSALDARHEFAMLALPARR